MEPDMINLRDPDVVEKIYPRWHLSISHVSASYWKEIFFIYSVYYLVGGEQLCLRKTK